MGWLGFVVVSGSLKVMEIALFDRAHRNPY